MPADNPISKVVAEIRDSGLTDACLFWFAYRFINGRCAQTKCAKFPPGPECDIPECVHQHLLDQLGVDMPVIRPKRKEAPHEPAGEGQG